MMMVLVSYLTYCNITATKGREALANRKNPSSKLPSGKYIAHFLTD